MTNMMELPVEHDTVVNKGGRARLPGHIGTWSYDIECDSMMWSDTMFALYDVATRIGPTLDMMVQLSSGEKNELGDAIDGAKRDGSGFQVRYPVLCRDGSTTWIEATGCVYVENSEPKRILASCRNVTAELCNKQLDARGEAESGHGLRDRSSDVGRLLHRASVVSRACGGRSGVIRLSEFSAATKAAFRPELAVDQIALEIAPTAAEFGAHVHVAGDDLLVIAEGLEGDVSIFDLSRRLRMVLDQPGDVHMRASGISCNFTVFEGVGEWPEFECYGSGGKQKTARCGTLSAPRQQMADAIDKAFDCDEFVVAYQPKIDFRHGSIAGFEALLRWQHPVKGLLGPTAFQQAFHDPETEYALSDLALDKVIRQLANWRERGIDVKNIAVNLAGGQVLDSGFFERFMKMTEEYAILPSQLKMEIREDILPVGGNSPVPDTIKWMRQAGFGMAFDDFGRGQACWKDIVGLSVDRLKIDRMLVTNLLDDRSKTSLVRSIIELAHDLKIEVIAEGVETACVDRALREWGCDFGQGFIYARPMLADAIPGFISQWEKRTGRPGYLHLVN